MRRTEPSCTLKGRGGIMGGRGAEISPCCNHEYMCVHHKTMCIYSLNVSGDLLPFICLPGDRPDAMPLPSFLLLLSSFSRRPCPTHSFLFHASCTVLWTQIGQVTCAKLCRKIRMLKIVIMNGTRENMMCNVFSTCCCLTHVVKAPPS